MGNCIICKHPKIAIGGGNRLFGLEDDYERADVYADFSEMESLGEIRKELIRMEDEGLHLIGSRGYVYHSLRMAEMVFLIALGETMQHSVLTRTGGLRQRVVEIMNERESS